MTIVVENSVDEQLLLKKLNEVTTAQTDSLDEIRKILVKIPKQSRSSWNHGSPLVWAVLSSNKVLVHLLVEEQKFDVNSKSMTPSVGLYEWCALGSAIKTKNEEMAKFLVNEMKADVNIMKTPVDNILTAAILEGNVWAVKFMVNELKASLECSLKMNANPPPNIYYKNPNPPSYTYYYPIHWAMWQDFQR